MSKKETNQNINKKETNNIFINSILQEKVKIPAKYLSSNRYDYILKKLKLQENKCSRHGYIKKNSIDICEISLGLIEQSGLQGSVIYNVKYKALVCNPIIGSIINVQVENKNQFGLLCIVKDNISDSNIIEIIVPKKSVSIKSDYNLDNLIIGDIIAIKLLGKKFHINDSNISGIGTVVVLKSSITNTIKLDNIELSDNKITDEDLDEDDEFEIEEEEEEEEIEEENKNKINDEEVEEVEEVEEEEEEEEEEEVDIDDDDEF
jgi:DNA-directed RNA polymerase subunit E'/Rpb7